jgi:hypothetical protein
MATRFREGQAWIDGYIVLGIGWVGFLESRDRLERGRTMWFSLAKMPEPTRAMLIVDI